MITSFQNAQKEIFNNSRGIASLNKMNQNDNKYTNFLQTKDSASMLFSDMPLCNEVPMLEFKNQDNSSLKLNHRRANHPVNGFDYVSIVNREGLSVSKSDRLSSIVQEYDSKRALLSTGFHNIARESNARIPFNKASEMAERLKTNSVPTTPSGTQQVIDSLTYMLSEVLTQQFFTQNGFDTIFPMDTNGGWSPDIYQPAARLNMPNDISAFEIQGSNNQKLANISIDFSSSRVSIVTFAFELLWNINAVNTASLANLDLVGSMLALAIQGVMSTIQKAAYLGTSSGGITGLVDQEGIFTDNQITFPVPLEEMTYTQINTVMTNLVAEFASNTSQIQYPDTFVLTPKSAQGSNAFVNPQFPMLSMIEAVRQGLESGIKSQKSNSSQETIVTFSPYLAKEESGKLNDCYFLFNRSSTNVVHLAPIPLTLLTSMTYNNWNFNQVLYFRDGGLYIKNTQAFTKFIVG